MLQPSKKYYTQNADQEDLISIGTIGLIKGISSFDPSKGARLATYAARCIENEILMYFRGQKKLQGEVSLSDSIDIDKEGNALQLMDVVGVDDTMLEDLHDRDNALRLRKLVQERLSPREAEIIRLRYGLGGTVPLTQREVASSFGISRSYVSRRSKCKRQYSQKHKLPFINFVASKNRTGQGLSERACRGRSPVAGSSMSFLVSVNLKP